MLEAWCSTREKIQKDYDAQRRKKSLSPSSLFGFPGNWTGKDRRIRAAQVERLRWKPGPGLHSNSEFPQTMSKTTPLPH